MNTFYKHANCPSPDAIFASAASCDPTDFDRGVELHLLICDFCSAEAGFYENFPQPDEDPDFEEIPPALYQLARSILNRKKQYTVVSQAAGSGYHHVGM